MTEITLKPILPRHQPHQESDLMNKTMTKAASRKPAITSDAKMAELMQDALDCEAEMAAAREPANVPSQPEASQPSPTASLSGVKLAARPAGHSDKGRLYVQAGERTAEQIDASLLLSSPLHNLMTSINFSRNTHGKEANYDMGALADELVRKLDHLKTAKGLDQVEEMALCQTLALDAIFTEMMRRCYLNMGEYPQAAETYAKLGFRAQAQCRATMEALTEMKNPRPVYLNPKQVNVANGSQQVNNADGPQQVNNGPLPPGATPRVEENEKPTNKLLEANSG